MPPSCDITGSASLLTRPTSPMVRVVRAATTAYLPSSRGETPRAYAWPPQPHAWQAPLAGAVRGEWQTV